jgi:alpha-beta hydrolase superfamily lysophospholipase
VEDVLLVAEEIHRRHPGRPLHSIGFSLGSPISLGASLVASDLFQSQILVSPGLATSLRVSWKTKLRMLRHAFVEPERLQDLPFTVHQLTDHEAWRELLEADPLRTRQVTARFILEVLRLQRFVRRQLHRVRSPLLCLLAGGDAIIDNQVVTTLLSRAGSLRVRIHVFEGAGHFLAASVPRAEIARHIHAWIREPAPTGREELTIASVNPYPLEALDRPWSAPADADPGSPA